jgi:APA family basic amino acid/polyamine antiporter
MYSFGAMLSFTIAHFAVVRLLGRYPDKERPWKSPFNLPFRGAALPVTGLVGGVGTLSAWIIVITLDLTTLAAGLTWMAIGLAVYFFYRRHQALPLRETVKVVMPEPLGVEEVEYRSVLVAFDEGTPFSKQAAATAVKLASRRRRGIHVISLVRVPTNLPIDADLKRQETEAQSKIEQAKLIGGLRVTGSIERVRPGQEGHAIADYARMSKAAAVVMALTYRNGTPQYGKTLQDLLSERPCRVLVVSEPEPRLAVA